MSIKLSELKAKVVADTTDLLYLSDTVNQTGNKITVANFFASIPDALFKGSLQLGDTENLLTSGTAIDDTNITYALNIGNTDETFTLSAPTVTNPLPVLMVKVIYLKATAGGKAIITGFLNPATTVTLSEVGSSVTLLSTAEGWIVLATN